MDYEDTKTQLNITLGDTSNITFTIEEKDRALQKAWNDTYVVEDYWDSSLTFSYSTYQYTKPSGVNNILDIYVRPDNSTDTEPEKIAQDLWEDVGNNIHFKNGANRVIPDGYTLYIKAKKKLDYSTDSITSKTLQEYVIALAALNTLSLLGYKKANLFLKNDTTMGELIQLKREMEREVSNLRARLPRAFVSV